MQFQARRSIIEQAQKYIACLTKHLRKKKLGKRTYSYVPGVKPEKKFMQKHCNMHVENIC